MMTTQQLEKAYNNIGAKDSLASARDNLSFVLTGFDQGAHPWNSDNMSGLHWILMDVENHFDSCNFFLSDSAEEKDYVDLERITADRSQ